MSKFLSAYNKKDIAVIINTNYVKEFVFNNDKSNAFFDAIMIDNSIYSIAKLDYRLSKDDDYFDNFLDFLNS